MSMEDNSPYSDLSLSTSKCIDVTYFLDKIKTNGYSTVALDQEVADAKQIKKQQKIIVKGLNILERVTVVIQNTVSLFPLGQQQVPYECDILAIKPLNQKIFHAICIQYDSYDVITFDIANKLPFMLKRNPVYQAIRKGKFFELSYEALFDESRRVIAMTNMINIIKATGGKNLIVSSNCSQHNLHRTPYDVAALLISLGLDKNKALATMKENCQQVIKNGQHRRFLKGAIQQLPVQIGIKLNKRIKKHSENLKLIRDKLKKNTNKMQEQPKEK